MAKEPKVDEIRAHFAQQIEEWVNGITAESTIGDLLTLWIMPIGSDAYEDTDGFMDALTEILDALGRGREELAVDLINEVEATLGEQLKKASKPQLDFYANVWSAAAEEP